MPSKLRAGGTYPFTLKDDRDEATQPQFSLRVLSYGESAELHELRQEFIESQDEGKRRALVSSMLAKTVASCNIEGHETDYLMELLTGVECWELINAATEGASLSVEERKKFVLPLQSDSG